MIKKINYNHSLIFFISCIFLSSFDYLRSNSFILICFFLILILGVSHGALDNIKGRKLIKILKIKNYINTNGFEKAVAKYSIGESAIIGGEIGWVSQSK